MKKILSHIFSILSVIFFMVIAILIMCLGVIFSGSMYGLSIWIVSRVLFIVFGIKLLSVGHAFLLGLAIHIFVTLFKNN